MNVHVAALADVCNGATNIMAIFQNSFTGLDVPERNFVAQWNWVESFQGDGLVGLHDPARKVLTRTHVFHHHNTDCIGFVVHDKLRSHLPRSEEHTSEL